MKAGAFDVVRHRLARHLGEPSLRAFETPADVVAAFGAVQAQDYLGALWAVGLRVPGAREADVERALAEKALVRTWPMRGTLHFVAAADVRWMLALLTPFVVARSARRLAELELTEADFRKARKAVTRALEGGRQRTRQGMYEVLEAAKVSPVGQRGIHVLLHLAQEGLLCFGTRDGKQQTFVLLDEWLPPTPRLHDDDALAAVAQRYFEGHGPATLADFTWWTGLPVVKARQGLESVKARLEREVVEDRTYFFSGKLSERLPDVKPLKRARFHLLPAFDEYLVGYRDREAVLAHARLVNAGGGMLAPTMLVDGSVVGTWRRELRGTSVAIAMTSFEPLGAVATKGLRGAADAYGAFLGKNASVSIHANG